MLQANLSTPWNNHSSLSEVVCHQRAMEVIQEASAEFFWSQFLNEGTDQFSFRMKIDRPLNTYTRWWQRKMTRNLYSPAKVLQIVSCSRGVFYELSLEDFVYFKSTIISLYILWQPVKTLGSPNKRRNYPSLQRLLTIIMRAIAVRVPIPRKCCSLQLRITSLRRLKMTYLRLRTACLWRISITFPCTKQSVIFWNRSRMLQVLNSG